MNAKNDAMHYEMEIIKITVQSNTVHPRHSTCRRRATLQVDKMKWQHFIAWILICSIRIMNNEESEEEEEEKKPLFFPPTFPLILVSAEK